MTDLYEWTNTDISGEAILPKQVDMLGVLDEVECGDHQGEPQLQQTSGWDQRLEGQTEDRGEAGLVSAHFSLLQTWTRPARLPAGPGLQATINIRSS